MNQKLWFLNFQGIHNSLPSFWAKLGYSRIKIDLLSLWFTQYSHQFKIGVHLLNVELLQLLAHNSQNCKFLIHQALQAGVEWGSTFLTSFVNFFQDWRGRQTVKTYQILKIHDQMHILCPFYLITTVPITNSLLLTTPKQ